MSLESDLVGLLDELDGDAASDGRALGESEKELCRMLSLHSQHVTTASSGAPAPAAAQHEAQERESFTKIGAGACGAIFAQDGKSLIVKLAKSLGDGALWNDFKQHNVIARQLAAFGLNKVVKIPQCYGYVPHDDPIYFDQHPALVDAAEPVCHLPTDAIVAERILPLPKAVRTLLIEKYCPPRIKQAALADPANKDCLVRVYLGSSQGRSAGMFFSLRNFKLHLNQMVELHLDIEAMARGIAAAMAIMHWAAKTDARDVEFALGSFTTKTWAPLSGDALSRLPSPRYIGPPSRQLEDFLHRTTELWLLDFNQVRSISMDDAGVAQAVEAARINDPYIPKPLQASPIERQAWNAFVKSYLDASYTILRANGHGREDFVLPRKFIYGLIEVQRRKQATA